MRTGFLFVLASVVLNAQVSPYKISTLAGTYQVAEGSPARDASLIWPDSLALDAAGNLYVGESYGARIRKVTPDGKITTYAGNGIYGYPAEGAKATETNITLSTGALALDAAGSLYVATQNYWRVHKVSPAGIITRFAGASCCSNAGSGDNGSALNAIVGWANGLYADKSGSVYIAAANRVRKVDPRGTITLVAGTGEGGYSGDNGPATSARLQSPNGLTMDADGNLYIADWSYGAVRKVTPDGRITTYAGGYATIDPQTRQLAIEGLATGVYIYGPTGLAFDANGNLYVTASYGNRILKIAPAVSGVPQVISIAGTGVAGFSGDGGPANRAQIRAPRHIGVDAAGNIFFTDYGNGRIRKIDTAGVITTVAGISHLTGDDGQAAAAQLYFPSAVATDGSGNLYIADQDNRRIRKVDSKGVITTVAGMNPLDDGRPIVNTSGPALEREIGYVIGIASDRTGNLYLADAANYLIRKISADGTASVVAGTGSYGNASGDGAATKLAVYPQGGVATDADGNAYFTENNRVRKLTPDGTMTTYTGNATTDATKYARLSNPTGLVFDAKGNLFISDSDNHCIRKVATDLVVTTYAGACGTAGFADGKGASVRLNTPRGLVFDSDGNLFVVDSGNARIRQVAPDGTVSTIAGTGVFGFSGDGGSALQARLGGGFAPQMGIALIGRTLYFSDYYNHRVRQLVPVAAASLAIVSGDGQSAQVGAALGAPLVVRVLDTGGAPLPGITVSFAVTTGAATLNVASVATGADGRAGVTVTMGNSAGPVAITATVAGLPTVRFSLTATPRDTTPIDTPVVRAVVNAFSYGPSLCPGVIASVGGTSLAGATQSCGASGGVVPATCGGVSVTVKGRPAAVSYLSPTQLLIQLPVDIGAGSADLIVERTAGGQTARSTAFALTLNQYAPALSTGGGSGTGPVVWGSQSGSLTGSANPAAPGDTVTLYAVGLGPTNPAFATGATAAGVASVVASVKVILGSAEIVPLVAAATPGQAGLYQVSFRVPSDAASGAIAVAIDVAGVRSPSGTTLLIGSGTGPSITSVQNNASPDKVFTAGSWISIYGSRLASTSRIWGSGDFAGTRLPVTLEGVSVKVNGLPAAVYYVSPTQINALAPADTKLGEVVIEVTNAQGTASSRATLAAAAPAFFAFDPQGGKYLAAVRADGVYAGPNALFGAALTTRPLKPGDTVLLYGTGFGATTPPAPTDQILSGAYPLANLSSLRITIGGVAARVDFAGIVSAGQFQFNVVVPDVPDGDREVIAEVSGVRSPAGKYLAVQR
jgi:trimeric autotransporter adhesin